MICERLNRHGPFACAALSADGDGVDCWTDLTTAAPLRARELHLTVHMTGTHWTSAPTINMATSAEQQRWATNQVATIDRTFTTAVTLLFTTAKHYITDGAYSALYGCAGPFLAALQNPGGRSSVRCLQFNFEGLPLPWGDAPRAPPPDFRAHGADTLWFVWPSMLRPTKRIEPNGFGDFLDALGNGTVHVRIENDPDQTYTRTQLRRSRHRRTSGAGAPSGGEGPAQFWTNVHAAAEPLPPPSHAAHWDVAIMADAMRHLWPEDFRFATVRADAPPTAPDAALLLRPSRRWVRHPRDGPIPSCRPRR